MTILTTLAVFILGLGFGAIVTYKSILRFAKMLAENGNMSLMRIHKCHDGHVHATLRTSNSVESEFHIVLSDRTGESSPMPERVEDDP